MNTTIRTLAVALLALGLHTQLDAAPAKEEGHADPEHARLVAARKAANEQPDVQSAQQQYRADRALATKAMAEYKAARKRSNASEEAYRKAFEAALAKADPGAAALQEKERAAFRERMLKARTSKKGEKARKEKVAAQEDDDGDDDDDDDKAAG
jgi:purine nucleoside permease